MAQNLNSLRYLKENKFSLLSFEEKLEIKKLGPMQPVIGTIYRGRKFNSALYKKHEWLTGCEETKKIYCFPCLLFGAHGSQKAWLNGICDWGHIVEKIKRHEMANSHIDNCTKLALLGVTDIADDLSKANQLNKSIHNQEVDRNRYILGRIIDCIKFCGHFELALRGRGETDNSDNPGIFLGLVNFTAGIDAAMSKHLNSATVFKGTSNTIQNELLNIMFKICQDKIREEIKEADFLAIVSDDTTDVSTLSQNVVTFRYVNKDKVVERFWSFGILNKGNAVNISNRVMECLDDVLPKPEDKIKLVAQCYDGAAVMSGNKGGVRTLVLNRYPNAYYVHCYSHQLNLIVQQSVKSIPHVRKFFQNLGGFSAFFTRSPTRTQVLNNIVNKRMPSSSATRTWSFASRIVDTVLSHKEDLWKCFDFIIESGEFDDITVREATGLQNFLEDPSVTSTLELFQTILINVDQLFASLQRRDIDSSKIQKCINDFQKGIQDVRDNIVPKLIKNFKEKDCDEPPRKRSRRKETVAEELSCIFIEVCDIICTQCCDRFKTSGHLVAASLLNSVNFANFNERFPDSILDETVQLYPFFEPRRLKAELTIIYSRADIHHCIGALALFQFLSKQILLKVYSEAAKLMKLLITIPMTSSEAERTFSTLKRVKNFLRNTMGEDRLNALSMLSMERKLVTTSVDFNIKVIDQFARQKDRRAKFLYK